MKKAGHKAEASGTSKSEGVQHTAVELGAEEPDQTVLVVNVLFEREIDADAVVELERAGLEIHETFSLFPIATGSVEVHNVDRLKAVKGVVSVEPNREISTMDETPQEIRSEITAPGCPDNENG